MLLAWVRTPQLADMSVSTRLTILVAACILLFMLSRVSPVGGFTSLYDQSMPLKILNGSTFHKVVLNTENAWIVQFYNHWCGHCINFSPSFRAFATDVAGWKSVVSLAVIDCVENMKACRAYGINSYPTIKFFRARSTHQDRGVEGEAHHNPALLRQQAVDFVDRTDAYHGDRPASWPLLKPLQELSSLTELWQLAPEGAEILILVVERNASYVGREVILDFSSQPRVYVTRLVTPSDGAWLKSLLPEVKDASHVPWADLYAVHHNNSVTRIIRLREEAGSRELVVQALEPYHRAAGASSTSTPATTAPPSEITYVDTSKVYLADLNNALSYSLRQEVAGHEQLNGTDVAVLTHFVDVLIKHFPGSEKTKNSLRKIHTFLTSAKAGSLKGEDLSNFLSKQAGLPGVGPYQGCRGSREGLRGYPCALWMLFHSLTVGAYFSSGGYPLGRDDSGVDALLAIRSYVARFFSCRECASHFGSMAKDIESEVRTSHDAVMWLWRAHNRVNARLAGDLSEDPLHPKRPFPPPALCEDCREGSQWDEQRVVAFLLRFYAPTGVAPLGVSAVTKGNVHPGLLTKSSGARTHWSFLLLLATLLVP
ncbi:sulfhydryl oxidase 2-like [Haemaphysalis longicornis]